MLKYIQKAVPAAKYIAPVVTLFAAYSLWVFSRTRRLALAAMLGSLLAALTALLFATCRRRFFPASAGRRNQDKLAQHGRLFLRMKGKRDGLALLLSALECEYDVSKIEWHGGFALGKYGEQNVLFALSVAFDGAHAAQELLDLYRACIEKSADRGVLFLLSNDGGEVDSLARRLTEPKLSVVHGGMLDKYIAKVAEAADFAPEHSVQKFTAAVCTRKNGVRCMVAAAYMLAVYIALGLRWFLIPALLLAAFASTCRHLDRESARLF